MAKLPKALIKKYGISKKAWAVFRRSKSKSRSNTPMARRKLRSRARSVGRTVKRYVKRGVSRGRSMLSGFLPLNMMETLLDVGIGASLNFVSNLLSPVTNWLSSFLGEYSNEAAMGLAAALVYKFSSGTVRAVAREYYRAAAMSAGAQLGSGLFSNSSIAGGDYI